MGVSAHAASLFITSGITGWFVFAAILLAGRIVKVLVDPSGRPSVKHGFPCPVPARASMGARGAQFPAIVRAVVAVPWYGAQTCFASTAVALALHALLDSPDGPLFLGMDGVAWVSCAPASVLQMAPFLGGIERIAYFAAALIAVGDLARNVRSERGMRFGNLTGLTPGLAPFTFLSVFITAGAHLLHQDGEDEPLSSHQSGEDLVPHRGHDHGGGGLRHRGAVGRGDLDR